MKKNVASQMLDILSDAGVKNIFGVTGDALNYFVKAIESQDNVKWIGVKHEGNAAFAAFAQGELGKVPGVCTGTTGPGALHLINGAYNAKKERSPLVVITGQVPTSKMGTNFFQEADLQKIFDDICAYQAIIRSPAQAPRVIQKALKIAMANRTVCRIELPSDIAELPAVSEEYIHPIHHSDASLEPGTFSVASAVRAINDSQKVTIMAGHGCRDCCDEVLQLSSKIQAPIVTTLKGSDVFHQDMENSLGLTGLLGNPAGYAAVKNCDLLLMLGTDFPYSEFLPKGVRTVQVDKREENIGNRTSVEVGVHSDIGAFLNKALPMIETKMEVTFLQKYRKGFAKWKDCMTSQSSLERQNEPLHPQIFANRINSSAAKDAIFTLDTGTSVIWASHHMSFHSDRRLIGSFNHGSMAVSLPAAIGAQLQYPEREVWCLTGDGAFNMAMQDFITAVKYDLPIKVVIFNNHELSFVKIEMEEEGLVPSLDALKETNVNFAEYAKLCGGFGVRVEKAEEIEAAITAAKDSTKPFIIDAVVSSGELSLPPNIGFSQAARFGKSKLKEGVQILSGDKDQKENFKKELQAFFD